MDDPTPARRRMLIAEVLIVLGLTLGQSAVWSIRDIIAYLTQPAPLNTITTVLNPPLAPADRPWLDLANQLLDIVFSFVVPTLLALHLLNRDAALPATSEPATSEPGTSVGRVGPRLGLDGRRPWFDLGSGLGLAAVIGIPGLALYLGATALHLNTTVAAGNLRDIWWAVPVYVLRALGNGAIEEIIMIGYLLTRLRELRLRPWQAVAISAVIRGSYHLYQGFGGFLGNAIMGVVFALFFFRFKRVLPLVIAHTVLDVVSFVGYAYLAPHLHFLP